MDNATATAKNITSPGQLCHPATRTASRQLPGGRIPGLRHLFLYANPNARFFPIFGAKGLPPLSFGAFCRIERHPALKPSRFFVSLPLRIHALWKPSPSSALTRSGGSARRTHPDIFASIDTQRRYLGRWLPFVADTHRIEQTRQVVAGMLADTANPVFTLRSGNAFAGLIGFKSADAARRSVEIGYWLREEQQGKGIMAAAVRTLCDLAFGEMGMRRVEIRCGTGNLPSNRIPQRLGFLRSHVEAQGEQLSDGEWIDLNVYVLER